MEERTGVWQPSLGLVFRLFLVIRLVSAFCMHISDCDETYNYWEPTHYLLYGSGFQTWEYSPAYAVRSYGYLLVHALPLLITSATSKLVVFYMLRVVLATVCACCETYFYSSVKKRFGSSIALWTLFFLLGSCGMYVASTAYLPSSFSMYLCMVAMGAWFQGSYELAIFSVAMSAIVGWPFSAALGLPIAIDLIFSKKMLPFFIGWSLVSFLIIAVPLAIVDSLYYGKFVLAPFNIVLYNVFGGGGPNLYGVEPWSFYFVNGFLNFNVVFLLAMAAVPLIEFQVFWEVLCLNLGRRYSSLQMVYQMVAVYSGKGHTSSGYLVKKAYRVTVQSMVIWMVVFCTRSHKEERFLFPIYPLFCLGAAVTLQLLPETMPIVCGLLRFPRLLRKLTRALIAWLPLLACFIHATLSLSRGYALYKGYHAPMDVYKVINSDVVLEDVYRVRELNVCVGKEWYRFPSSFFLPNPNWNLHFIQSDFKGQLPKPYGPHRNATWIIPENMNDENLEEPSRYYGKTSFSSLAIRKNVFPHCRRRKAGFDIKRCHVLVDLDLPRVSEREPRYIHDTGTWELVAALPFLDSARSHRLFRSFYIPWLSNSKTTYVNYIMLKNRILFGTKDIKELDDIVESYSSHKPINAESLPL